MIISTYLSHIVSAATHKGIELKEVARLLIKHKITGFDVIMSQLNDDCMENIKILKNEGMQFCSLPVQTDFVHNFDKALADKVIMQAEELGAKIILVIPGFFFEQDDREALRRNSLEGIKYMQRAASAREIYIGVEDYDNINSCIAGIEGVNWYLENNGDLELIFDSGSFVFMGDDTLEAFDRFATRIKHQVHIKDVALSPTNGESPRTRNNGTLDYPVAVGNGIIPNKEILRRLMENGFDGIITIENFGSKNPLHDLISSADYITKCIEENK